MTCLDDTRKPGDTICLFKCDNYDMFVRYAFVMIVQYLSFPGTQKCVCVHSKITFVNYSEKYCLYKLFNIDL